MRAEPSEKLLEVVKGMEGTVTGIHINMPYICDCCQDEKKEAFPYRVEDREGRLWTDLCNDCFEELGCIYDAEEAEGETDEV